MADDLLVFLATIDETEASLGDGSDAAAIALSSFIAAFRERFAVKSQD